MFVFYIALGPYHNRAGAVYKYQVYKYRKIRIFFGSKNMFFGVSGPLKIRFFRAASRQTIPRPENLQMNGSVFLLIK